MMKLFAVGIRAISLSAENVLVFKEPGRFGGWPANHGIWSWGNEILVGFSDAYFKRQPWRPFRLFVIRGISGP